MSSDFEVGVVPDFTPFFPKLKSGIDQAIGRISATVANGLRPIEQIAARAGDAVADRFKDGTAGAGHGLIGVSREAQAMAASVSRAASEAGSAVGDQLTAGATRGAAGFRQNLDRTAASAGSNMARQLSAAGEQGGRDAGAGFGREFEASARSGTDRAVSAVTATIATAGAVSTGLFAKAIDSGYQRFTTIEDAQTSIETILGSAREADTLMAGVLKTVQGTPFTLDQFADAAKTLVAFNIEADKVPSILSAIGEAGAASGRGAEGVSLMVDVFGQMSATGKVSLDDVWRISSGGVNALAILANAWGVTTEEMQKMISDGAVPAGRAIDALTTGIVNGSDGAAGKTAALGGTMNALRESVSGALGGIQAAGARFGAAFLSGPLTAAPRVLNAGSVALDKITTRVKELSTAAVPSEFLDGVVKTLESLSDGDIDKLLDKVETIAPFFAAAFSGAATSVAGELPVIGELVGGLNPLAAAAIAAGLAIPQVREAVADVAKEIAPAAAEFGSHLMPVLEDLVNIAGDTLPVALRLTAGGLEAVMTVGGPLLDVVSKITGFLADQEEVTIGLATATAGLVFALKSSSAGFRAEQAVVGETVGALGRARAAVVAYAAANNLTKPKAAWDLMVNTIRGVSPATAYATAGVVGFVAGASLALNTLSNEQSKAEEAAKKLDAPVKNPLGIMDHLAASQKLQAEIAKLNHQADESGLLGNRARQLGQNLNPFDENSIEQAKRQQIELNKLAEEHNKKALSLVRNYKKVQDEFGLSQDQVAALATKLDVDLSGGFRASKKERLAFIADIRQMSLDAQTAGIALDDAVTIDPEILKKNAEAVQQASQATAAGLQSFTDVFQLKDEPLDPQKLEDATKAVEDAEKHLAEVRAGGKSSQLRDAEQRLAEAQREASTGLKTVEEARKAADAVRDAREKVNDIRASTGDDIQDAADALKEAKDNLAEVKKTDAPLDGTKIAEFYWTQITKAREFSEDIDSAIRMGLDPDVVGRMLTEGPEKAGPLLEAIVSDTSGNMVKLVNSAESEIDRLTASTVRKAQLTQQAINEAVNGDPKKAAQMAVDLNAAVTLDRARSDLGGKGQITDLAARSGLTKEEAQRIAEEFQIDIAGFVEPVEVTLLADSKQPIASLDDLKKRFQQYVTSNPTTKAEIDNAPVMEKLGIANRLFDEFIRANPTAQAYVGIEGARANTTQVTNWLNELDGRSAESILLATASTSVAEAELDNAARTRDAWINLNLRTGLQSGDVQVGRDISLTAVEAILRGDGMTRRWGGVHETARWGRIPAHVTTSPTILYGERETGGEAMIPRFGDLPRSEEIAKVAAGWLGGRYITRSEMGKTKEAWPMAAGGVWTAGTPNTASSYGDPGLRAPTPPPGWRFVLDDDGRGGKWVGPDGYVHGTASSARGEIKAVDDEVLPAWAAAWNNQLSLDKFWGRDHDDKFDINSDREHTMTASGSGSGGPGSFGDAYAESIGGWPDEKVLPVRPHGAKSKWSMADSTIDDAWASGDYDPPDKTGGTSRSAGHIDESLTIESLTMVNQGEGRPKGGIAVLRAANRQRALGSKYVRDPEPVTDSPTGRRQYHFGGVRRVED